MSKYVKTGSYTTQEESIEETLQEMEDVIQIAKITMTKGDTALALTNLDEALHYLEYVRRKVKIALRHVPGSVCEQEFL